MSLMEEARDVAWGSSDIRLELWRDPTVLDGIVGASIVEVAFDSDDGQAVLVLDDGRRVFLEGVWHNDSTAGLAGFVLPPTEVKARRAI